jgi:hypothetical protein
MWSQSSGEVSRLAVTTMLGIKSGKEMKGRMWNTDVGKAAFL